MKDKNENADPIQQSVHVDCPVEDAFRLFTEGFGKWWPLAPGSEIEPGVGGRVLERSPSGVEREWGEVTAWNPPGKLEFTWNPGGPKDDRQAVSVEFQKEADGTKVTLTHRGWHFAGVAVCVSGSTASASHLVHGLAVSWAPNWKPVAVGRELGAGPAGLGKREIAWRNAARPTWAEVFVSGFAAFVAEHEPAAV
jgi:uncharacterized protein YndB with AHSA1/START domain